MRGFLVLGLLVILAFAENVVAQDIVAKLKPEYKDYLSDSGVVNKRLNSLFIAMKIKKAEKLLKKKYLKVTSLDNVIKIHLEHREYAKDVAKALEHSGYFQYVQVMGSNNFRPLYFPNDPIAYPTWNPVYYQYYLAKINAFKAWDITKGDTNVVTCIVDNGVEWTHPELTTKIKYNQNDPIDGKDNDNDGYTDNYIGWDLADNDPYPEDSTGDAGHGTEVSSVGFALTDNDFGIASIGFNCKFIPVKIFNYEGTTSDSVAYGGIIYAADHGCKVINLSWGQVGGFTQYGQDVVNYAALDNDAVIVAATFPQEGDTVFTSPADYDNVLSALALQSNDLKSIPQSYNYWIDMSVPGIDMFTATIHATFKVTSGISFGTPLISGTAALIRGKYPWMNSTQVRELLRVTGTNIDTVGTNVQYKEQLGHGRLDAYKALTDTVTPAVQIPDYELNQMENDTLSLQLGFVNYLWPSKNLTFTFRSISGGFQVIDSTTSVGVVPMLDSSGTVFGGIKLFMPSYPPADNIELVRIGISDTANGYVDYQYFYIDKNQIAPVIITATTNNATVQQGIKIYPNPCTENVYIELDDAQELTITDLAGRTIAKYSSPSDIVSVSMKDYPEGVYLAQVRTNSGTYSSKFLKNN